jgi:hypothetical protein
VPPGLPARELAAKSALRRLTAGEYDNTVRDLLGESTRGSFQVLTDTRNPFDNDYTFQQPSKALVEGAELLARDVTSRFMLDRARRDRIVGCKPAKVDDAVCFGTFLKTIGTRALRRPFSDAETQRYLAFMDLARANNDFYFAVEAAVRSLLQHPEFLYRVETGTPVAGLTGLFKLTSWEMATRLAYFLWGTVPSDQLFERAQANKLATTQQVRDMAATMLADTRARDRLARFHTMWIGYDQATYPTELAGAMKAETDELMTRVLFDEKRPWQDLFRMNESFVSAQLATHYGMKKPASLTSTSAPQWVSYQGTERKGLLSQASFLSLGAKFGDTSPTERGKAVRELLFCQDLPPRPPEINADNPPTGGSTACKYDRYMAIRRSGAACMGCHLLTDSIGLGLENYNATGGYRRYDVDVDTGKSLTQCPISGDGEVVGVGTFKGPAGLGTLLLESGIVSKCAVTQVYRFASGRHKLDSIDLEFLDLVARRLGNADFRWDELLLDFVSSPAFAHRRTDS